MTRPPDVRPADHSPLAPAGAVPHPVVGPLDRVHFLDEQRRHRRASWRFSALAALAVLITGIPACLIATPLVFAVVLTVGHIVDAVTPISPSVWESLRQTALAIPYIAEAADSGAGAGDWVRVALALAVLVLPGAISILVLWFVVRRLLGRVAVGHALERSGAREPNPRDAEERQLVNLVEEMAVAAGVKPPRVLILDSEVANAAATGIDIDDATVLVTRGLLDRLDRDETQAVIAHVVASVGNGDLRIVSIIYSIYETWGALTLLMHAPIHRDSRRALWRALRMALRGRRRAVDRWEAEFVSEAFLRGALEPTDVNLEGRADADRAAAATSMPNLATLAALPMILGALVVQFAVFISSVVLIGPIVAFLWRRRRQLADASAVQLTRNPTALLRALGKLGRVRTDVPAGGALAMLFVVWQSATSTRGAVIGEFTRMHPKLHARERRLLALGATAAADVGTTHRAAGWWKGMRWTPVNVFFTVVVFVVLPALTAVAFALSIVVIAMLTMVTLMMMMVLLLAVWWVLKLVFETIPGWIAG